MDFGNVCQNSSDCLEMDDGTIDCAMNQGMSRPFTVPDNKGTCLAKGMQMAIEHIVIHKENDYQSAFPDIIRLQNGSLMVVFSPSAGPSGRWGSWETAMRNSPMKHLDADSRIALVRSTDDGETWSPNSHTVVDALRRITGS